MKSATLMLAAALGVGLLAISAGSVLADPLTNALNVALNPACAAKKSCRVQRLQAKKAKEKQKQKSRNAAATKEVPEPPVRPDDKAATVPPPAPAGRDPDKDAPPSAAPAVVPKVSAFAEQLQEAARQAQAKYQVDIDLRRKQHEAAFKQGATETMALTDTELDALKPGIVQQLTGGDWRQGVTTLADSKRHVRRPTQLDGNANKVMVDSGYDPQVSLLRGRAAGLSRRWPGVTVQEHDDCLDPVPADKAGAGTDQPKTCEAELLVRWPPPPGWIAPAVAAK